MQSPFFPPEDLLGGGGWGGGCFFVLGCFCLGCLEGSFPFLTHPFFFFTLKREGVVYSTGISYEPSFPPLRSQRVGVLFRDVVYSPPQEGFILNPPFLPLSHAERSSLIRPRVHFFDF